MIFWLFYVLLYVKWSAESDFPFTRQPDKIDGIIAVASWKQVDIIENYMISGMVRESLPYNFLIIVNAILCEMTHRVRISN